MAVLKRWLSVPLLATTVTIVAAGLLFGQERGWVSATLDVEQRFESAKNLGLELPDEGTTNLSSTSVSLNFSSELEDQSFELSLGGVLRAGDIPSTSDISTGFTDPSVKLAYSRQSHNAAFEFDGSFQQTDVALLRSVGDFVNEDGEIELPEDLDDLSGTGKRNAYSFSTSLETGLASPLGFVIDAGASGTSYSGTSSTSLNDTRRTRLGLTSLLKVSSVTTGRIALKFDRFEADDTENTERDTYSIRAGVENEISDSTVIDAEIGYEEVDTDDTIGTPKESGLVGAISVERELNNGSFSASVSSTLDQSGDRLTVEAERVLDLPNGNLATSVGVTQLNGGDADLIGSVSWLYVLPSSQVSLRFNRSVSTNNEDEERLASSLDLNYTHEINSISNIGLNLDFAMTDTTATSNRVKQAGVSVSYNRELTKDWGLTTGVSHRIRDENTVGSADSTSVFVALQRSFDLWR